MYACFPTTENLAMVRTVDNRQDVDGILIKLDYILVYFLYLLFVIYINSKRVLFKELFNNNTFIIILQRSVFILSFLVLSCWR